jgi:hypothetical protein
VTALLAEAACLGAMGADDVEVAWITPDAADQSMPLGEAWSVPFECGLPVRRFTARKGQWHLSGLWWCATSGGHVGFESWLERDQLMLLDFDAAVSGIASQPLWLRWTGKDGRRVSHAPDYFIRRADGSGVVVDCRPVDRRPARDVAKFAATAAACAQIGWEYQLLGAAEPVATANVRWLAGYRHPRHDVPEIAGVLRQVFATPIGLHVGAGAVGDPIAVLPALFHLLWRGGLVAAMNSDTPIVTLWCPTGP